MGMDRIWSRTSSNKFEFNSGTDSVLKVTFHESTFKEKYSTSFMKVNKQIKSPVFLVDGLGAGRLRRQAFDHS